MTAQALIGQNEAVADARCISLGSRERHRECNKLLTHTSKVLMYLGRAHCLHRYYCNWLERLCQIAKTWMEERNSMQCERADMGRCH
jgi:hypothetical protein